MSSFASTSTSSAWPTTSTLSAAEPPSTPTRTSLPLYRLPVDACPPRGRNARKRAPPSPLESNFHSEKRRDHLFTLSTACNRRLHSPSTPAAPLLPPAPIFVPLLPTTPSPTSPTGPHSSAMKRSPAMRNLCQFTADAFHEERERSLSSSSSSSSSSRDEYWHPASSLPSSVSPNSLGLFDFYRDSPALGGSPSSFSSSSSSPSSGRWSDAPDSGDEATSSSLFSTRLSKPSPPPALGKPFAFRTIPLPDIASLHTTARPPLSHSHSTSSSSYLDEPFSLDLDLTHDEPASPVPSLTFSSPDSSPASSLASLSSPSPPSTPSPSRPPSPLTSCISTFASTSFFNSPSPLSSGSSLAMRRLDSLEKRRRAHEGGRKVEVAFSPSRIDGDVFGLGLSA